MKHWAYILALLVALGFIGILLLYASGQRLKGEYAELRVKGYAGPPLKLLFFSDFHLASGKSPGRAREFVRRMRAEQPDLILFGGDLITDHLPLDRESLDLYGEIFRELDAPLGVYAVFGNHDCNRLRAEGFYRQFCREAGWHLLENERLTLPGYPVDLTGLADALHQSPDPGLQTAADSPLTLILMHEPDPLATTPAASGPSLVFAGHSHHGQVTLFGYPLIFPKLGRVFYNGWYRYPQLAELPANFKAAEKEYRFTGDTLEAERYLYVSPGAGTVHLPFRFFAPQSYLVLELRPED